MSDTDAKVRLIEAIVKGGVSVILSIGLLGILGVNTYLTSRQIDLLEEWQSRQTQALEQIARTYSGK